MTQENGCASPASSASRQVTVIGGTGYIASQLIKQLLEKGYTVHATVRGKDDDSKVGFLNRLAAALPGKLCLFEGDLLTPGAFDEAIKGSEFVFHTASPVVFEVKDSQAELLDPAVKGTVNVLDSVTKAGTVKRTVLTSSIASVRCGKAHKAGAVKPLNGLIFTEADWNEHSEPKEDPYGLSKVTSGPKVTAERAAWDWAKKTGADLVCINPGIVLGPVLQARASETASYVKSVLEGDMDAMFAQWAPYVDVRDVARAHIRAAEIPTASGRYLITHTAPFTGAFVSQVLRERFPQYEIPDGEYDHPAAIFDHTKADVELGIKLMSLEETLVDSAVSLINLGAAKPRLKKQANKA